MDKIDFSLSRALNVTNIYWVFVAITAISACLTLMVSFKVKPKPLVALSLTLPPVGQSL